MRRVFGWLADAAGCGYYRVALPLSNLDRRRFAPEASDKIELDFWNRYDTVVAQRTSKPMTSRTWREIAASPNTRAVYELDDDFWSIPSESPAKKFFAPETLALIEANIAAADVVTVSTEPLADRVRAWNPNVVVIPNYVDARLLSLPRPEQAEDRVTIGWGGSPTHSIDWKVAEREIVRVVNSENARLAFVGSGFPAGMPRDKLAWLPWQPEINVYYEHLAWTFDIGVAPLAHHEFNRSKSAIKVLEYMALGLPSVASDEAPYAGLIRHGETGFLVKRDHEWGVYLRKLIKDRDLRVAMGEAARRQAADWTIQGNVGRWAAVLG
ncbi:MAG TPA: glycosyltransferase [Rugosimonospora sp.]|nr:glycosyltransferase [Rugosimonospora sp.]